MLVSLSVSIFIHVYIYRERETDRQKDRERKRKKEKDRGKASVLAEMVVHFIKSEFKPGFRTLSLKADKLLGLG